MKLKVNLEDIYLKYIQEDNINKDIKKYKVVYDDKIRALTESEKQIIYEITENNLELRQELLKIMNLIKNIKFLTPDMLNTIYSPNRSPEENSYNLLQLSSLFGGPLNKKTYSVLGSKYVYTNNKYKFDESTLNYYNKASYIICKVHSNNEHIKIININTEAECDNKNNVYSIINITLCCNKDIKQVHIIPNIDSYTHFKNNYGGIYLNTEKVGEILNKINIIEDFLLNNNFEKIKDISNKALLFYEIL